MKSISYTPTGVCSQKMNIEIEGDTITKVTNQSYTFTCISKGNVFKKDLHFFQKCLLQVKVPMYKENNVYLLTA